MPNINSASNTPLTILAFDYGLTKIGVAIGNTLTYSARPLCILKSETKSKRFELVEDVLQQWQPDMLVVGLPLTADGGEQESSKQARRFANQLNGRFSLQVQLVNEYGSSLEAQEILGNNNADDAVAAQVILQRYFDQLNINM